MTAVVPTIDTLKAEGWLANAAKVGQIIQDGLAGFSGISEVHGRGLMIGVDVGQACGDLVRQALDAGLVINVTAGSVVRLLPPLVMSEAEGRQVVERLGPLVQAFLERSAQAKAAAH